MAMLRADDPPAVVSESSRALIVPGSNQSVIRVTVNVSSCSVARSQVLGSSAVFAVHRQQTRVCFGLGIILPQVPSGSVVA